MTGGAGHEEATLPLVTVRPRCALTAPEGRMLSDVAGAAWLRDPGGVGAAAGWDWSTRPANSA